MVRDVIIIIFFFRASTIVDKRVSLLFDNGRDFYYYYYFFFSPLYRRRPKSLLLLMSLQPVRRTCEEYTSLYCIQTHTTGWERKELCIVRGGEKIVYTRWTCKKKNKNQSAKYTYRRKKEPREWIELITVYYYNTLIVRDTNKRTCKRTNIDCNCMRRRKATKIRRGAGHSCQYEHL